MEPEESTAPPAYQSLVRSLSERSLGYLERMRRADFGYQTMASREDGGGSFVSSAPSLKRRPSPQDSIPTLKRDSSARSGLDSFTSVTQDRRWEPKYSKRVERVSGVGLPPHLYKSRLQHVFTLAPRFSSPRLGQGIAGSLGPGAYAGSIIQPAKAELPGTAGGQLRKKRHSSMIELPVGSTGALGPGSYNPQPLQSRSVGHLDFGRGKRKMAPPASYVAPGTYDPPDVAGRQLQQPGQSGYTFGGDERDLMSYVKVRVEAGPGSYHPRFDPLSLRHRPSAACSGKETSYGLSADSDSGPAGGAAGPSVGPGTYTVPTRPPISTPAGRSAPVPSFAQRPYLPMARDADERKQLRMATARRIAASAASLSAEGQEEIAAARDEAKFLRYERQVEAAWRRLELEEARQEELHSRISEYESRVQR